MRPAPSTAADNVAAPTLRPLRCTCARVRRASRALTQLYDDALAPTGLRLTQFSLLRSLDRLGPTRISALADAVLVERTALSRNLDPLIARRLLAVAPGRDARTREVMLTAAGRRAIANAEASWLEVQADVEQRFGRERLEQLHQLLAELEALRPPPDAVSPAGSEPRHGASPRRRTPGNTP